LPKAANDKIFNARWDHVTAADAMGRYSRFKRLPCAADAEGGVFGGEGDDALNFSYTPVHPFWVTFTNVIMNNCLLPYTSILLLPCPYPG
jgi:hypothetical protein